MSKIFIPSTGPNDWKPFLADSEKHWVRGRSARSLAHSWEDCEGFPYEIKNTLQQASSLADIEALLVFPEWKVPLPGGNRASQNDVWVLAKCSTGLVSIAIEGKVEESFDKKLSEWLVGASPGKLERLNYLVSCLGLSSDPPPGHIYYQLMHRTASAIIEAERFGASSAVMLIHTFSPSDQWFEEFRQFAKLFGIDAKIGELAEAKVQNEMPLYLGWVHGDERYLSS
ncbi:MAG: hypothetical protein KKI15_05055 [Proteobacteria bacterium]|nr:hypothetical protein [Pseudomonadota bacterium]